MTFAFGCAEEIKDTSDNAEGEKTPSENTSSDNSIGEDSAVSDEESSMPDESSNTVSDDASQTVSDDVSDDTSDTSLDDPVVEPDDPVVEPDDPVVEPDDPVVEPDDPIVEPDDPIVEPDDPVVEPDDPVVEPDDPPVEPDDPIYDIGDAEILESGYLIYNGAAYCRTYYSESNSQNYADVYAAYARMFPNVRISAISHPLSAINITNPAVREMINDQGLILDQMESHIYGDVNFVNLKDIFIEHRGEYLFFKSDYHWTQRGAYYAYYEFAKSIGLTPTPLFAFDEVTVTDSFIGRINDYAHDDRILSFVDTVYAYMPKKSHTMTVYNSNREVVRVYNNCIQTSKDSYSCFLTGDQPFTVINVPNNDQEKAVLVIKESSGNAFVPFLTGHYGNIIVVDPRHINVSVSEIVEEFGVDDIIFFANASTSNSGTYCGYYWNMLY